MFCKGYFTIHSFSSQVIEAPCPNGTSSDAKSQLSTITFSPNPSGSESKDNSESYSSQKVPLKSSGSSMMNHEDTLEVILRYLETFFSVEIKYSFMRIIDIVRTLRSSLMRKRR